MSYNIDETAQEINEEDAHNLLLENQNNNGLIIIPWTVITGFIVDTEKGFVPTYSSPNDYSSFNYVFTGKDNVVCCWEGVVPWKKAKGANECAFRPMKGNYYLGELISGEFNGNTDFASGELVEEMVDFKSEYSIKVHTYFPKSNIIRNKALESNQQNGTHYFFPQEQDKYKFYTIPTLTGKKWLYISNIQYMSPIGSSDVWEAEITFSSVSDKLRKTGMAQEQFIQYAAAGDPHIEPLITFDENDKASVGYQVVEAQKITHIQVELLGPGMFCGIGVYGRNLQPVPGGTPYSFNTWKQLLAYSFFAPNNSDYNRNSAATKNFYYFPHCGVEMYSSKDLFDIRKQSLNSVAQMDYSGCLTLGDGNEWTDWTSQDGLNADSIHLSNPVQNIGIHWDYFNIFWKPLSHTDGEHHIDPPTYNCSTIPYCEDTIAMNTNMNFVDIFNLNSMIFKNQLDLPLGFRSSKPFRASNIAFIGGMLAAPIGDWVAAANTYNVKPISFGLFGDTELLHYLTQKKIQNNPIAIFLDDLVDSKDGNWSGADAMNTTMCWELTDKFEKNNTTWDTKYLGQRKDEFGDDLPLVPLYGSDCKVVEKNEGDGFSIDKILIQALYKGNIRISMYSYDNPTLSTPIWQTTIMSSSSWTKSIRNWTSIISTGGIPDVLIEREDNFTWPETPEKQMQEEHSLIINWSNTLNRQLERGGCDWFTIPAPEQQGKYLIAKPTPYYLKAEKTGQQTYSFEYSTVDEATPTRAQFLQKYKSFDIDLNGSFGHIYCQDILWNQNYTTENKNFVYNYAINGNTNTLTKMFLGINRTIECDSSAMPPTEYMGCCYREESGSVVNEGQQQIWAGVNITINFQEYQIQVLVEDATQLTGTGSTKENLTLISLPWNVYNQRRNQIDYTLKLNKIIFKE